MVAFILFVLVISLLVFVHELGHFVTAKLAGVHVQEFAMGFPPRLFGIRRGETTYSVNLLPLGGYVKMAGEEDAAAPRSLAGKSRRARAIILSAGAFNNILLAVFLFAVVAMVPKHFQASDIRISKVFPSSPAASAGMLPGDIVRHVNGQPIESFGDLSYQLRLRMGASAKVEVERDGKVVETRVSPRWVPPAGEGATGIVIATENSREAVRRDSFFPAVWNGARRTVETLVLVKNEVTEWFLGKAAPALTGPIGVAQLTGEVAGLGLLPLLELAALLSLNLGVMNILPLPALDGGRLFFLGLEAIRGKAIPAKKEAWVHMAGFVLLMTTMLIISYFDIMRIAKGGSLIGN